jgi:hypothetical protein
VIPLSYNCYVLEKIAIYLNNKVLYDMGNMAKAVWENWEFEFGSLSQEFLFELLEAADRLGIPTLSDSIKRRI